MTAEVINSRVRTMSDGSKMFELSLIETGKDDSPVVTMWSKKQCTRGQKVEVELKAWSGKTGAYFKPYIK